MKKYLLLLLLTSCAASNWGEYHLSTMNYKDIQAQRVLEGCDLGENAYAFKARKKNTVYVGTICVRQDSNTAVIKESHPL